MSAQPKTSSPKKIHRTKQHLEINKKISEESPEKEQEVNGITRRESKLLINGNDEDNYQENLESIKRQTTAIKDSISGVGTGYNKIVGINPKSSIKLHFKTMQKKQTKDFSDENDPDYLRQQIADRDWREVLEQCQKYKSTLVNINLPPMDFPNEDVFIFSGFVKPGQHALIVYDPLT